MRHRFGLRAALIGTLASALLAASGDSASGACDANTTGTSTCTGTLTTIDKTATGDLVVLLQDVEVTTSGIDVGDGGFGYDLSVIMDSGFDADPIFSGSDEGIAVASSGGDVVVTTILGGTVEGLSWGILGTTSGSGTVTISTGDSVTGHSSIDSAIAAFTGSGAIDIDVDGAVFETSTLASGITAITTSGAISIDTTAN